VELFYHILGDALLGKFFSRSFLKNFRLKIVLHRKHFFPKRRLAMVTKSQNPFRHTKFIGERCLNESTEQFHL
jgi:hypothetical protein